MNGTKRKFGLKHGLALFVGLAIILALAIAYFIANGFADQWARRTIVDQLEKATGAHVELGNFHIAWRKLTVRFDGLTLHGREPAGSPPLFHADTLMFDINVDSFWRRKISLANLEMAHFSANVQVAKDGSTNIPGPKIAVSTGAPDLHSLFDLKVAQLHLSDGTLIWNDRRIPLEAKGGRFEFAMNYVNEANAPVYLGQLNWQQFEIAALRNLPFSTSFTSRFTLRQTSFSVTQLQWKIPGGELDAQANLPSFAQPAWTFRYRGQLRLEDMWTILRQRGAPGGHIDFAGDGNYSPEQMNFTGRYTADRLTMKYQWFHPGIFPLTGVSTPTTKRSTCRTWKPRRLAEMSQAT